MKQQIESVGIIGFGSMGQFMAERMFEGSEVVVHDPFMQAEHEPHITAEKRAAIDRAAFVSMGEIASSEAIVLAVPAKSLKPAIVGIAEAVSVNKNNPLIVDVCSVKEYPSNLFKWLLGGHEEILLSHPLFGPQSAKDSMEGRELIVTETKGDKAEDLLQRWQQLGLKRLNMSAARHDEEMAAVLGMPSMLGRLAASNDTFVNPFHMFGKQLVTPGLEALRRLIRLDYAHSDELFETIVAFNPYAQDALAQIIKRAHTIQEQITENGVQLLLSEAKEGAADSIR